MPVMKVVVAAATFTGTCITSLITGVFRKPPPTPVRPATAPPIVISDIPSGTRLAWYGTGPPGPL